MKSELSNVGLVLSGGGAKGAYQAGVVRALSELGISVSTLSGASIGALNGAIIACSKNLDEASERLTMLWQEVSRESPVKIDYAVVIKMVLTTAIGSFTPAKLPIRLASILLASSMPDDKGILKEEPLDELINEYICTEHLNNGIPLYVSLYPSQGALLDIVKVVFAGLKIKNTTGSEYHLIQHREQQIEMLKASAAIPLAFSPKEINGSSYSDGGQGDWEFSDGNTPIKPLIDNGCKTVIVTHLQDGVFWNRKRYPDTNIIEIRPQKQIKKSGFDLLNFSEKSINSWMEQGYQDTMHCIGRIIDTQKYRDRLTESKNDLKNSIQRGNISDTELEAKIKELD